jgi:ribosome biogenesis GTPase
MTEADALNSPAGRSGADAPSGRTRQDRLEGLVIAIAPELAEVHTACGDLLCTFRGRLRRGARPAEPPGARRPDQRAARRGGANAATAVAEPAAATRIAVGDQVLVTPLDAATGVIEELVLPRRRVLARGAARDGGQGARVMLANLDHAVLVLAVRDPAPHFGLLDRYLALCEHAGVDITICLNKVDLGVPPEVEAEGAVYAGLGYQVLWTSALTGAHMDELRVRLGGRVSLLTGPSGVGKSSQVNALLPEASQRIGAISTATGKGRHTTTGARLLPLPGGGWLADSAGIRELALWNVPADELARGFVELRDVADDCVYEDCAHGPAEEGCALRAALAEARITPARFASFERLLREARGEAGARV